MRNTETRFLATSGKTEVSALALIPDRPEALLVLGHGAGSTMRHPLMEGLSQALARESIGSLRYQYPYSERGRRPPDPRQVLLSTVRAAVAHAEELGEGLPLFAGGHSMSGRMTTLAAADAPLAGVRGIACFAFPLAGKTEERTAHFAQLDLPVLFVQGTRDKLTPLEAIRSSVEVLGARATLEILEGADHSLAVLRRSGKSQATVLAEVAKTVSAWMSVWTASGSDASEDASEEDSGGA